MSSRAIVLPTMNVRIKKNNALAVINETDYNPELHVKMTAEEAKQAAQDEALAGSEDDPLKKFKVFRTFETAEGMKFEKDAEVDIPYSVAQRISEKYGSIWPVAQLSELDDKPELVSALLTGEVPKE